MQITLVDAISVNGKITKGEGDLSWLSAEDQAEFARIRAEHDVIVLDRKSYQNYRPKPQPGTLRIVLTRHPERFGNDAVPNQLEFLAMADARTLASQLEARGFRKLLIAGGSTVAAEFLAAGLVDELIVTFEPLLLGNGRPMIAERELDVKLQLKNIKQLNDAGTLLAHYTVIRVDPPASAV